jgi:squalene monooxygenase
MLSSQVHGYAMYKDGSYAQVKYPIEGYTEDVAGRSFHHGCFVQQLRHKAASQPTVTIRQAFVRGLINGEGCLAHT